MKVRFDESNNRNSQKNDHTGQTSKAVKFTKEYNLSVRLLSVLLMIGLLIPLAFFGQPAKISAQTASLISQVPPSVSAPPEPLIFSSNPTTAGSLANTVLLTGDAVNQSLTGGYRAAAEFLIPPSLPEGFAMAKLPTLGERVSNSLASISTSTVDSIESSISSFSSFLAPLLFVSPNDASLAAEPKTNEAETPATETDETISGGESMVAPEALAAPLLHAQGTTKFDFDGDGKADAARWQSSSNEWKIKSSQYNTFSTLSLGTGTAAAPADYDGDGKTDHATFTEWAGKWKIRKSSSPGVDETVEPFGMAGDKVVSGNYDGDPLNKADLAVWRPSTGTWYVRQSSNLQVVSMQFGAVGDIPVPGNYDGDNKMDYAVFRPSNGYWYLLLSASGYSYTSFQWGAGSDTPVPADYDNDGRTDFAVYRPSNGTWYVNRSNGSPFLSRIWGNHGDQPVPADYDGDGKADFAVWRPTTGVWYIANSWHPTNPSIPEYSYHQLGIVGDTAVPSAYLKQIGGQVIPYNLANARLSPKNATGGTDLYSRNFGWGASLVDLPGRAGLDAGFGISYNSLVWTKEPTSNRMIFDADNSNISPGFRFGFPTIEPGYYNALTEKFSYMMVTPSGGRVEFRQAAASGVYETADSSYAQLKVIVPTGGGPGQTTSAESLTLTVTTTDGTMMDYSWKAGAYRLNKIKDRNGNFISVVYDDEYGLLRSVTDTLGRIVTVQYDAEFYPITIKQDWKASNGSGGTVEHIYATFSYTYTAISPNFDSTTGLTVFGPSGGTNIRVLNHISYPSGNSTTFEYNSYGQVYKIRNVAADSSAHVLNSTATDLFTPAATEPDCPRFTKTYNYVENFNGVNGQPAETLIHNKLTPNGTFTAGNESLGPADVVEVYMDNAPPAQDVRSKTYYYGAGNWGEGLPFGSEDVVSGVRKRWTRTMWTQDDTTKVYKVNPRVTESRVGDETNTKKTKVDYHLQAGSATVSRFGLVKEVRVYDTDQTTVLKKSVTDYNFEQTYLDRRLIGLPLESELYEGEIQLQSKMTYGYDGGNFSETEQAIPSVIQHDTTNYSTSFIIGRGNPTSMTRCDAPQSSAAECVGGVTSSIKYNIAGATVAQITPGSTPTATRQVKVSYADKFNDTTSRNTYAYPTKITDPADNFSKVEYRYDTGANVYAESPVPAGQAPGTLGKITKRFFDTVGRLEKQSLHKNGTQYAYTKYEYPPSQNVAVTKTTLTASNANGIGGAADEVTSETFFDGAGRVYKSRSPLSFNTSGGAVTWTGQKADYDLFGRVKRQTVPTEIDANWNATNTDQTRGWQWTSQEYDWKGRVTREIGLDNVDRVYEYEGCGCAGGQVTTVKGELVDGERRTQKMYADILGKTWKTEVLDYDDNVYTSTVTKYNGRDQAVWTKQFVGAAPGDALGSDSCPVQPTGEAQSCQIATSEYDGHGRLTKSRAPQQDDDKFTAYTYNAADEPETVTDARGAVSTYAYNSRGLVETIQRTMPINQPAMRFATCAAGDANCFTGGESPATSSPIGYLDYADSTSRVISGWSLDRDAPNAANEVHFYIDGPAGGGGTGVGTTIADKERPDVNQYYPGNHGYEFVVPEQYADGKPHLIYAYGIDVSGNNYPTLLTNSPKSILLNPATKTTTFVYDNLGNRTKMTDETGVTDYEYDALSRVKAEKKHLRNSWSITRHDYDILYEYNLTGQLKSVTDPFGDKIDYGVDKGGKLEKISGTPFNSTDGYGTAAVTDYINDIEYRAWGAVKSIDYGNTVKMSQTFDSRLRVGEFNVQKDGATASLIKKAYQYYNDDRLKFSDDTGDATFRTDSHRFDRSYNYDFMGRLSAAKTNAEARGVTTNIDRSQTPYKHDYGFNAFGNVTSRQTFTWTEADNQTHVWQDGRESTWIYDADGRLKHTPENNYDYDAAGATSAVALADKRVTYQMTDGEARTVRRDYYRQQRFNGWNTFEKTEYAIYSSVLGKLLTEVKSDGTKKRTYVYGAVGVVATQNNDGTTTQHVAWGYQDPSNASYISTTHSGAAIYAGDGAQAELDPLGSNVGFSGQVTDNQAGPGSGGWGDPFGSYTCMVDWVISPCSQAAQVLSSGAGNLGPIEQFRRVTNRNTGETAWGQFRNYGNSMTGWWADFFSGPSYSGETIRFGTETHSIRYNNSAPWRSEYRSAVDSIIQENPNIFELGTQRSSKDARSSQTDNCDDIIEAILGALKGLKKRFKQQNQNKKGEPASHGEEIGNRQNQLGKEFEKFDRENCTSNDPKVREAREYLDKEIPMPNNNLNRSPSDLPVPPIFVPIRPILPMLPNPGLVPATPLPPMIFPPGWECIYLPQLCSNPVDSD